MKLGALGDGPVLDALAEGDAHLVLALRKVVQAEVLYQRKALGSTPAVSRARDNRAVLAGESHDDAGEVLDTIGTGVRGVAVHANDELLVGCVVAIGRDHAGDRRLGTLADKRHAMGNVLGGLRLGGRCRGGRCRDGLGGDILGARGSGRGQRLRGRCGLSNGDRGGRCALYGQGGLSSRLLRREVLRVRILDRTPQLGFDGGALATHGGSLRSQGNRSGKEAQVAHHAGDQSNGQLPKAVARLLLRVCSPFGLVNCLSSAIGFRVFFHGYFLWEFLAGTKRSRVMVHAVRQLPLRLTPLLAGACKHVLLVI